MLKHFSSNISAPIADVYNASKAYTNCGPATSTPFVLQFIKERDRLNGITKYWDAQREHWLAFDDYWAEQEWLASPFYQVGVQLRDLWDGACAWFSNGLKRIGAVVEDLFIPFRAKVNRAILKGEKENLLKWVQEEEAAAHQVYHTIDALLSKKKALGWTELRHLHLLLSVYPDYFKKERKQTSHYIFAAKIPDINRIAVIHPYLEFHKKDMDFFSKQLSFSDLSEHNSPTLLQQISSVTTCDAEHERIDTLLDTAYKSILERLEVVEKKAQRSGKPVLLLIGGGEIELYEMLILKLAKEKLDISTVYTEFFSNKNFAQVFSMPKDSTDRSLNQYYLPVYSVESYVKHLGLKMQFINFAACEVSPHYSIFKECEQVRNNQQKEENAFEVFIGKRLAVELSKQEPKPAVLLTRDLCLYELSKQLQDQYSILSLDVTKPVTIPSPIEDPFYVPFYDSKTLCTRLIQREGVCNTDLECAQEEAMWYAKCDERVLHLAEKETYFEDIKRQIFLSPDQFEKKIEDTYKRFNK